MKGLHEKYEFACPSGSYTKGTWTTCTNYLVAESKFDGTISVKSRDCDKCKYRLFKEAGGSCRELRYAEVEYVK